MGYWSNGTEGRDWEEEWCRRCAHGQDLDKSCPVMDLHEFSNYDQCHCDMPGGPGCECGPTQVAAREMLDHLIPRETDECQMFTPYVQIETPLQKVKREMREFILGDAACMAETVEFEGRRYWLSEKAWKVWQAFTLDTCLTERERHWRLAAITRLAREERR